jgi:DNA mismatch repair protein MutS
MVLKIIKKKNKKVVKKPQKEKKQGITDFYLNFANKYRKIYGEQCIVVLESGHFMEVYGYSEDEPQLQICRDILNIMVTRRDKTDTKSNQYKQFMAGIPTHSIKKYYKTLLRNNFTVVIVSQITSPPAEVIRKVTQILSPGCSLSEDIYNNSDSGNSVLVSLMLEIDEENEYYVDISTFDTNLGNALIQTLIPKKNIRRERENMLLLIKDFLSLIDYNEIVINIIDHTKKDINVLNLEIVKNLKLGNKLYHFRNYESRNKIQNFFTVNYQKVFLEKIFSHFKTIYCSIHESLNMHRQCSSSIANYIILLNWVSIHDQTLVNNLQKPEIIDPNDTNYLKTFNDAYEKLNVFYNKGDFKKSLFKYIDFTSTKQAKRKLKAQLKKPIIDADDLNKRYDYIEELYQNPNMIEKIGNYLKIHDLQRIYRRFSIGRLNPYEIPRLKYSNSCIIKLIEYISLQQEIPIIQQNIMPELKEIEIFRKYNNEISNIFDMEKCSKVNLQSINDTLFMPGFNSKIDVLLNKINSHEKILKLIAEKLSILVYQTDQKKGIVADLSQKDKFIHYVSVKHNDKEGYWFDITKKRGNKLMDKIKEQKKPIITVKYNNYSIKFKTKDIDWNTKNKTNMKLFSPQIKNISTKITSWKEKLSKLSKEIYLQEIDKLYQKYYDTSIKQISQFITDIDVIKSNSKCAYLYRYSRPKIKTAENSFINASGIRHPIIERLIKEDGGKYISNSIEINQDKSYLIYGVNSSGKSSFLKSLALSIIMAQSGLFVAAKNMEFSLYHKLFTRMGNDDNLFINHSSFVKEMSESKEIIRKADNKSFVIADELCASTEIDSALKIVSSIVKILSNKKSSFIFATHMFKLVDLTIIRNLDNVKFKHLKVDFKDNLIFERILTDGLPSNRQYGAIVAEKVIQDTFFSSLINNQDNFCTKKKEEQSEKYQHIISTQHSKYNAKLLLDKCSVCNYMPKKINDIPLETHHINMQCSADSSGFHDIHHKNELHNLVGLCRDCHQKVHKDIIVINGYIDTDNGRKLDFYTKNNNNLPLEYQKYMGEKYPSIKLSVQKSKKKKKKYSEQDVKNILQYYKKNKFKSKTTIVNEIRNNENSSYNKISIQVFNKIINNKYLKNINVTSKINII